MWSICEAWESREAYVAWGARVVLKALEAWESYKIWETCGVSISEASQHYQDSKLFEKLENLETLW